MPCTLVLNTGRSFGWCCILSASPTARLQYGRAPEDTCHANPTRRRKTEDRWPYIPYTSKDSKTRSVAQRPSDRGPFVQGPKNVTCVKMRWHSAALFYLADLRLLVATRDDIFWLANLKLKRVARIKNRSRYLLGNRKHSGSKARILRA